MILFHVYRSSIRARYDRNTIALFEFALGLLISIAFILRFQMIFLLNLNWDEFSYLALIHDFASENLNRQFQTFHVHIFRWLPHVFSDEISQIITARVVMYFLSLGSSVLTYIIARQTLNRSGALFAVLCYLAFSYNLEHGTSFRFDPICAFLFLLSIFLLITRPLSMLAVLISASVMAVSVMITIKSLFHILTIVVIFLLRLWSADNSKPIFKQMIAFCTMLIICYFLLYSFHSASLQDSQLNNPSNFISTAFTNFIIFDNLFPRWDYLKQSIIHNFVIWVTLFFGLLATLTGLAKKGKMFSKHSTHMFAFMIPFVSLIFYRNSFPYFYVFILSPGIVFCGVIAHWVAERIYNGNSMRNIVMLVLMPLLVFFSLLLHYTRNSTDQIAPQKETIEIIHTIFPTPVPYIDRCSMVSSFPKVGFFMSTMGMEIYQKTNVPVMQGLIDRHQPVFLLANTPCLDLSLPKEKAVYAGRYKLFEEDWNILKSNYIHHWGIIYLAGKQFRFDSAKMSERFEILVSGLYTYEGDAPARINGVPYKDGDVIYLQKGAYNIAPQKNPAHIALRWGNHIYKPAAYPSLLPVFTQF
jgi:hypothetical protein